MFVEVFLRWSKTTTTAVTGCVSTGSTYAPDDVLYERCDDSACSVGISATQHLLCQLGRGGRVGTEGSREGRDRGKEGPRMGGSVGRMDRKVRRDEIGQLHLVI